MQEHHTLPLLPFKMENSCYKKKNSVIPHDAVV